MILLHDGIPPGFGIGGHGNCVHLYLVNKYKSNPNKILIENLHRGDLKLQVRVWLPQELTSRYIELWSVQGMSKMSRNPEGKLTPLAGRRSI